MNITKRYLKDTIKQIVKELRRIPKGGGWDHIGEAKVKISRESLEKIIKEELLDALNEHGSTPSPGVGMESLWRDLNTLLERWPDKGHQYYKDLYNLLEDYSTGPDRSTRLPASAAPEPEDRWASLERAYKEE